MCCVVGIGDQSPRAGTGASRSRRLVSLRGMRVPALHTADCGVWKLGKTYGMAVGAPAACIGSGAPCGSVLDSMESCMEACTAAGDGGAVFRSTGSDSGQCWCKNPGGTFTVDAWHDGVGHFTRAAKVCRVRE